MGAALLTLVLAQADGLPEALEALRDASRAVREQAAQDLAAHGPPSRDLVPYIASTDRRVGAGVAEALRLRGAADALPDLGRLADAEDADTGRLAAETCVAVALARHVPLEQAHFEGMRLLARRLAGAADAAVERAIEGVRGQASLETPHLYRALYACGDYAAAPLERVARDAARPARVRAHALHAHARLTGDAGLAEALLDAADPEVRSEAATLVLCYEPPAGMAKLAGRLDDGRTLAPAERACAIAAAGRLGRAGDAGTRLLERAVMRDGPLHDAVTAAASLHAIDAGRAAPVVKMRVDRLLALDRAHPGAGAGAALFALRCGPFDADLATGMRDAPCPLLAAAVEEDRAACLAALRPLLSRHAGSREGVRVQVIAALLDRHDAPAPDRVAFAASALDRDGAGFAACGLAQLRGVPPGAWAALRGRVEEALGDPGEGTRLAAADLLVPDARAVRVCVDALWDGDPRRGVWAARLLATARPDLPPVPPDATAAERRRIAYALRAAAPIDQG